MAEGIWAGLRVIELAGMVAGPYCGRILAAFGADVVKVEPPGAGDPARRRGPFLAGQPGPERSALFAYLNVNKRGITLDPFQPSGRALLHRLLATADVLIEDLPPRRKSAAGVDQATLFALNPRLVVASITPFGATGPYADYRAEHIQIFHAGGEGYLLPNGLTFELFPDRPPLTIGGYAAAYHAGLAAMAAIAAALMARLDDGVGQAIDLSQQEVQLLLSCMTLQRYTDGYPEHRSTRSFRYGGVLPCKDGYVEVLTVEQQQWEALLAAMGHPAWADDERFRDPISRGKHGDEINRHLRAWSAQLTTAELFARAKAHGVPAGIFHTPAEVCASEHERVRGFFQPVVHEGLGPLEMPTFPFRFSAQPPRMARAAPRLGQDNLAVFCDELGLSAEDLATLVASGIV